MQLNKSFRILLILWCIGSLAFVQARPKDKDSQKNMFPDLVRLLREVLTLLKKMTLSYINNTNNLRGNSVDVDDNPKPTPYVKQTTTKAPTINPPLFDDVDTAPPTTPEAVEHTPAGGFGNGFVGK